MNFEYLLNPQKTFGIVVVAGTRRRLGYYSYQPGDRFAMVVPASWQLRSMERPTPLRPLSRPRKQEEKPLRPSREQSHTTLCLAHTWAGSALLLLAWGPISVKSRWTRIWESGGSSGAPIAVSCIESDAIKQHQKTSNPNHTKGSA